MLYRSHQFSHDWYGNRIESGIPIRCLEYLIECPKIVNTKVISTDYSVSKILKYSVYLQHYFQSEVTKDEEKINKFFVCDFSFFCYKHLINQAKKDGQKKKKTLNSYFINEIMAAEQRILKQDGYLDVGSISRGGAVPMDSSGSCTQSPTNAVAIADGMTIETTSIVYHPNLNVILVFDSINQIKVLDVHSGVILQTYHLESGKFNFFSFFFHICN